MTPLFLCLGWAACIGRSLGGVSNRDNGRMVLFWRGGQCCACRATAGWGHSLATLLSQGLSLPVSLTRASTMVAACLRRGGPSNFLCFPEKMFSRSIVGTIVGNIVGTIVGDYTCLCLHGHRFCLPTSTRPVPPSCGLPPGCNVPASRRPTSKFLFFS